MATDSTSAGYLAPSPTPAPDYDRALEDVLQALLAALTGLPGTLVRPRWQPIPPVQPDFETNWLAFGVSNVEADVFASVLHDTSVDSVDSVQRTELVYVLVSAYGPGGANNLAVVREGLSISQNREALRTIGANLVECSSFTPVPALMADKWVRRVDMTITLRRSITRQYPVLHMLTSGVDLNNELYTTSISTTTP